DAERRKKAEKDVAKKAETAKKLHGAEAAFLASIAELAQEEQGKKMEARALELQTDEAKKAMEKAFRDAQQKAAGFGLTCEVQVPQVVDALLKRDFPKETADHLMAGAGEVLDRVNVFKRAVLTQQPKGKPAIKMCQDAEEHVKTELGKLVESWSSFERRLLWNDMKKVANAGEAAGPHVKA
ncbi:unnamed protein product, partial [Prorocentrum cordatum]